MGILVYEIVTIILFFFYILLFVSFFILSERKILGYIQFRKGPNKVGFIGLLQSFSDFFKLFFKICDFWVCSRNWFIILGLVLLLLCSLGYVLLYTSYYNGNSSECWLLWFLIISCLVSFCFLCVGWGSYSKYAVVGALRFAFSSISFEACFMCIIIVLSLIMKGYSGVDNLCYSWLTLVSVPLCYFVWFISVLCESSRTPFDFMESESELVSGLNVEYSGVPFICLFACEYLMMYIFSWLTSVLFFGGSLFICIMTLVHILFLIWCRGVLPRIRFDLFVSFMWEYCLVLLLFSLFIVF